MRRVLRPAWVVIVMSTAGGISNAAEPANPELAPETRQVTPDRIPSAAQRNPTGQLDPVGRRHIPIGLPNSLDALKTFVEAEGCFSPGIGSYGIYHWVYDRDEHTLTAPTMNDVACTSGLAEGRYLIPWAQWSAGHLAVRTEVCEVRHQSPKGEAFVVGSRARLTNTGDRVKNVAVTENEGID